MNKLYLRTVTTLLLAGLTWLTTMPANAATQTCKNSIRPSTPTSQFADHGDGTVSDNKTGLMWAKCVSGRTGSDCATLDATGYNWKPALEHASNSFLAGHDDWRLPNIKELASIIEESCEFPAVNESVFPGMPSNPRLWSSSPYHVNSDFGIWSVDFDDGIDLHGSSGNLIYVRLVRGGK